MERGIDFSRERRMLCGICGHRWAVDLGWIDRWEQSGEKCAGCGLTCEHEDAPRVTFDPGDPALDDDRVALFAWYHTSTQPDWPTRSFDPTAVLTPETRRMMGGAVGDRGSPRGPPASGRRRSTPARTRRRSTTC